LGIKSDDSRSHGSVQVARADIGTALVGKNSLFSRISSYEFSLVALFSCTVVLSITDLLTTSMALRDGMREGNIMLLGIASAMGISFFQAIATTKLGFITGTAALSFLGIKSNLQMTRKIVFGSMIAFVVLLLVVSLNNLILIAI
jgi:hypothetical protein